MTPEEIGKKQDQTDQTNTWFQNRGLFSGDYLQVPLPRPAGQSQPAHGPARQRGVSHGGRYANKIKKAVGPA